MRSPTPSAPGLASAAPPADAGPPAGAGPPDFLTARNRRQKARAAGLHPDYWYAVEHERAVRPGQVVETRFWNTSIAVYRGRDGVLRALENRCAHRQLKLSLGEVDGDQLVCPYHGWCYEGTGRLARIPHDLCGRPMPNLKVRSYPLQVRYGLIWIFPGDPARAAGRRVPDIPELEGPDRWACVPIDFTWRAHHSMIIDNVSDFTHAHLHRKYRPFVDARLTRCEAEGDRVHLAYDTTIGGGRVTSLFVDRARCDTSFIELCYDYPYQWSSTGGKIRHWCFLLPLDAQTTRVFFLFYFDALKLPLLPVRVPRWLMTPLLHAANRLHIVPLLKQDQFAVEAEQEAHLRHFDAPLAELNPAVGLFQQVTIRKWAEHLAQAGAAPCVLT